MDLSLTDDQKLIRESVSGFFRSQSTLERVRAAEPLGFDPTLWEKTVDLGLPLMGVSNASGGTGGGMTDMCLAAFEVGRNLAPVPLIDALAAFRLLEAMGQHDRIVDAAARVVTLALRPAVGGIWEIVPAGAVADIVVGLERDRLVAISHAPPQRERPMANLGCAPLADRAIDQGKCIAVVEGGEASRRFARARDEWQVLTAAALVGLAERAVEMALGYVKERKQFGVPIGSFQTIAHRLADVATQVEGARILVHKAGWALDECEGNARALASMAFIFAAEVAEQAAGESLHFHGGYGFTREYDIQLFYRRAKAWPLVLGSARHQYRELAAALLGPVEE
jgi:alkylation response protein AidB-like acyl-CoA dehydrogenase